MNQFIKEKNKIIEVFEKHPGSQGKRPDGFPTDQPYDRMYEISKDLNFKWRGNNILKLEKLIKHDFDNNIISYGLINCKWKISATYKAHQDGIFKIDVENGGEICKKILNGEIIKLNDAISQIKKKFNLKSNNHLYLIGIKDIDYVFPYKKIGVSNDVSERLYSFETHTPFDYFIIKLWEIEIGKEQFVESLLHKTFKHCRKKREWFIDDDTLLDKVEIELLKLNSIKIEPVDQFEIRKINFKTSDFKIAA